VSVILFRSGPTPIKKCHTEVLFVQKKLRVQEATERNPRISQRLGPMSFQLVFGNPSGDVTELVEDLMHGYVLPIAVAVVLSTKAIFGFAHCGRASGLLGRRHGQAAQRRNSAPPTSQAAQHPTSGIHVSP
jgi:hypothetical protein